ncbi:MAG TPA: ATPase [Bacteroidales bacterium]|nr:ATPase [Bacteroidales bacterium]
MNKKIAIPLENGVLCAHFGHCQAFSIVEVKNNAVISLHEITPPEHQPGLYPGWIAQHGVTDVIAGGMGQQAISLFNQHNINVFVGAPVKGAKQLAEDFLLGRLSLSSNYCDH